MAGAGFLDARAAPVLSSAHELVISSHAAPAVNQVMRDLYYFLSLYTAPPADDLAHPATSNALKNLAWAILAGITVWSADRH
jgi:hypothetical protein